MVRNWNVLGLDELAVEAFGRSAVNAQPESSTGHPITKAFLPHQRVTTERWV